MSLRTKLESQLINLRSFRSFFPLLRTVGDMLMLPAQMARKGGRSNTFPFVININITTRCNLHCPYCFNAENKVARADELTLDEYRRLAAQWAPYRPGVFLSGGEPFAREDVIEIVEAFKRFGLPVGLVSNGTLMTADQARRLADLGLNALLISIHGGRETHDRTVGMTGAYDRSLAALRTWTEMKKRPELPETFSSLSSRAKPVIPANHINTRKDQSDGVEWLEASSTFRNRLAIIKVTP